MLRVGKSWAGAFLAAAVVGSLSAAVAPSQAAAPAGHPHPAGTAPVVVASGLHNPRAVRIQPASGGAPVPGGQAYAICVG